MQKYLITGATGYIGSMLAEKLLQSGKKVTVLVREASKLKESIQEKATIIEGDITERSFMERMDDQYDCLFHCAAPTQSAYMISHPVEVIDTIVNGTKNILDAAVKCQIKRIVYLSSMEVYGVIDCSDGRRTSEATLGELNVSSVRSCYPMAKRMAENLCYSYCKEYGVAVAIARLAQTFGRGVSPEDGRIFAQFARSVKEDKDIVLHTQGFSVGNYCDIDDTLDALLFLSEKGEAGEAYNVVNEANTMMIREMAELVSQKVAGGAIQVKYDIPEENRFGYAPDTGLRLSGEKLARLGWKAQNGLEGMYREMLMEKDSEQNTQTCRYKL